VALATAEGEEGAPLSVRSGLEQLDANLQKLPPFSYAGEYATHEVSEPLGLPKESINRDQAAAKAREFLQKNGYTMLNPQYIGESQGTMPCYLFGQQDVYLEITKQGGQVRLFKDRRQLGLRLLTAADAKARALNALSAFGWSNMAITSVIDNGSSIQIEAVSEINGIRYYPDKVIVNVAMDNGQINGIDATPYWAYHHSRALPQSKLTLDEARKKLRRDFLSGENRMALIPKEGNQEVLCYEFRGRYKGEEYIIYLNVATGAEEQIKRVIKTPRGEYMQ
jgi:spore germination protein